VPVKVNLDGGPIAVGDPITLSKVSGIGAKATSSGKIIGYAIDNFTDSAATSSKIIVLVQNGYWINENIAEVFAIPSAEVEIATSIRAWLASLEIVIEKGLIRVKEIIVEVLTANKVVTKQFTADRIQIKDGGSGDMYCVRIINGEWWKTRGECAAFDGLNPSLPVSEHTTSTPNVIEESINTSTATTTAEIIIESTNTGTSTNEIINTSTGTSTTETDLGNTSDADSDEATSTPPAETSTPEVPPEEPESTQENAVTSTTTTQVSGEEELEPVSNESESEATTTDAIIANDSATSTEASL
jgi:hypothetical protein